MFAALKPASHVAARALGEVEHRKTAFFFIYMGLAFGSTACDNHPNSLFIIL